MSSNLHTTATDPEHLALQAELADIIASAVNLNRPATSIDPDEALYGSPGLGLDSIDILEVALAVSQRYGFSLRADSEDNLRIFSSLAHLAAHVAAHRSC
ncbi:phosphopantetheine-binding protein [Plasticicumulans sp.]|uniref:phosphopantetheine-binding protein n=1 Tax=Plasticicumulans sp. TaxID=2307179 RepID=UPI002B8897C0|nr:phosphopantetheine-binding protein [Plasticicumulans sp.]HNE01847.1 phosphopantetheine-binding protein [Plasticicumulans sp.]HNM45018.1 phosphopantetheine-binding protein [Plasticicumulans sp.]HNO61107.1 phosphopantetheine-binding protein [Plasticicumulans sp.]